ncbi:MAG: YqeG family HAD IIIA-type phosphatase [Firmicutes bacterium]|nr:YqeG family HAD IIIA-type phosphatase [Bacillota bacterium]
MPFLKPDFSVIRVTDLDLDALKASGIKGLLLDADNTLLPYAGTALPEGYRQWLDKAASKGFRIVVFTNNFKSRAGKIEQALSLPLVYGWVKPWPWGMARAVRKIGLPKESILLVGDQLFTDILGARLAGLASALVEPLTKKDHAWTAFMRKLERLAGRRG